MDQRADCSSRPAATAMAAPAELRSPRAHRSYPQISRLSCVTGSWWRSQPCLQKTVPRTGCRRRWWPKISSPPPTPGCWRLLSNCDCPRSCRPNRSGSSVSSRSQGPSSFAGDDTIRTSPGPDDVGNDQPAHVDESTLPVPAPRRYRDKAHLRYVAQQPCLLFGRKPSDPHHLRFLQQRALGRKASDEFSVCRIHHRLVHRVGNEAAWWKDAGIDPAKAARKLWNDSRIDQGRISPGPTAQVRPRLPGSSGTTAASIRGGSRPDRRRKIPRQIEPLRSGARILCR